MTQMRFAAAHAVRLVVLAAALATTAFALADDQGDVTQLIRAGKMGEALGKADQYLATKPKDPHMRFLKGVIQMETGYSGEAITTFTKLIEDYPELPEPYNNLAVLYAARSQLDKARASLELAMRTNPSYATAHENLGDVYAKLASQAYGRALQLDTSSPVMPPKLAVIRDLSAPVNKGGLRAPAASAALAIAAAAPGKVPIAPPAAVAPAAPAPSAAGPASPAKSASAPAAATAAGPASPAKSASAPAAAKAAAPAAVAVPAASASAAKEVEAAIHAWVAAWSSKQVGSYLAAYAKEFDPPGNQSRQAWEQERRLRIVGKSRISVTISNLAVTINASRATARFQQRYSADTLNVSSRKTLELIKSGDRWLIVRETSGT